MPIGGVGELHPQYFQICKKFGQKAATLPSTEGVSAHHCFSLFTLLSYCLSSSDKSKCIVELCNVMEFKGSLRNVFCNIIGEINFFIRMLFFQLLIYLILLRDYGSQSCSGYTLHVCLTTIAESKVHDPLPVLLILRKLTLLTNLSFHVLLC